MSVDSNCLTALLLFVVVAVVVVIVAKLVVTTADFRHLKDRWQFLHLLFKIKRRTNNDVVGVTRGTPIRNGVASL